MAAAAAQEERRDTECTVCHEAFTVPKILPCGHILCRHCLLSWLQTQQEAQCPLCRYPVVDGPLASHHSYEDVANALPTHLILAALVEAKHLLSKQHLCCVCENITVVSLCISCGDMFCRTCSRVHKKQSATKHHQVESLTTLTAEELAAKRSATCTVHASELAQLYCPTHSVSVCLVCSSSDHRQCPKMVKADASVADSRELLTQVVSTLTAGERKLEGGIEEMEGDLKELRRITDLEIKKVQDMQKRLEKVLGERCSRLEREIMRASGDLKEKILDGKAVLVKERGRFLAHSKIVRQFEGFSTHGSFGDMAVEMKKRAVSLDCSDDLVTSVRVTQQLALTFDPRDVTRIEQELIQLGDVNVVETKMCQAVLVFHDNHGKKIHLSNGGLTATRTDTSVYDGIVISRDPMIVNKLYEVRIDAINSGYNSTFVGAVTCSPETYQIPQYAYASKLTTVVCAAEDSCMVFGERMAKEWPGLKDVQVGSMVGVSLDSNRGLHLYVNSNDQGVITSELPDPCYFMFDLFSRCSQVTAQPVRPAPAL